MQKPLVFKRARQGSNLQPLVPKANRFIFGVQGDVE
jgi:hypothetical protein